MLRNTFLALTALASLATGQCGNATPPTCSALAITGNGAPGTALAFDLDGPPLRFAFALIADSAGTTTVTAPGLQLDLGIQAIWYILPLGVTDPLGNATATIDLPPALTPASYHAQGLVFELLPIQTPSGPAVTLCTSNVEGFSVGSQT